MNSKKIETKKEDSNIYPCLKYLVRYDLVVLFTDPNCGMVVYCDEAYIDQYPVGESRTDWLEDSFNIYDGTIELSN